MFDVLFFGNAWSTSDFSEGKHRRVVVEAIGCCPTNCMQVSCFGADYAEHAVT